MIDVLVAGGGPAGLATALYAARAGLEAVVVEPRSAPVDKACGEGLMPAAVRELCSLTGADVPGVPFRGIRYLHATDRDRPGPRAEAIFRTGPGMGVRRTLLHSMLLDSATRAGVRIVEGSVRHVEQSADSVRAGGLRARYLVGADGLHSAVRSDLGLGIPDRRVARYGLRRHFEVAPWTDLVEVHWSDRAEAYVTPVGPELVGVAVLGRDRTAYEAQLAQFGALVERLPARAVTATRGAGPLRQRVRARTAGRVLLVGDAAGYVDALTGEGVALSLASARSLVDCLTRGRPQDYEGAWRRATRRYRVLTEALLLAGSHPVSRRALVPAAARLPRVFSAVVNQLAG